MCFLGPVQCVLGAAAATRSCELPRAALQRIVKAHCRRLQDAEWLNSGVHCTLGASLDGTDIAVIMRNV